MNEVMKQMKVWHLRNRMINWLNDHRGTGLTALIIEVSISLIVMAFVVPIAMEQFLGANTTGWSSAESSIWNAIPIFAFLAFLIAIIYIAFRKYRG